MVERRILGKGKISYEKRKISKNAVKNFFHFFKVLNSYHLHFIKIRCKYRGLMGHFLVQINSFESKSVDYDRIFKRLVKKELRKIK